MTQESVERGRWRITASAVDVHKSDGRLGIVAEGPELPGWEAVVEMLEVGVIGSLQVQPAGAWWQDRHRKAPREFKLPKGWRPPVYKPLTARVLRAVPVGALTSLAAASVASYVEYSMAFMATHPPTGQPIGTWEDVVRVLSTGAQQLTENLSERPGARGRPDAEYLPLVIEYVRLLEGGDRTPVATLARRWNFAPSTLRNRLHEARRRGLLTGSRGRAVGVLTPKAYELLHQQEGPHHGQR